MKKVKVEENNERFSVYECPRCRQDYCENCNNSHIIDFEVEDAPEGWHEKPVQWKNWEVCPWCYNQLIGKAKSKGSGEE